MKKYLEEYSESFDWRGDYMTLVVEKSIEEGQFSDRYRIKQAELQMWQEKKELVKWLRLCADAIEGMK